MLPGPATFEVRLPPFDELLAVLFVPLKCSPNCRDRHVQEPSDLWVGHVDLVRLSLSAVTVEVNAPKVHVTDFPFEHKLEREQLLGRSLLQRRLLYEKGAQPFDFRAARLASTLKTLKHDVARLITGQH